MISGTAKVQLGGAASIFPPAVVCFALLLILLAVQHPLLTPEMVLQHQWSVRKMETRYKLQQLKNVVGLDNLITPGRV